MKGRLPLVEVTLTRAETVTVNAPRSIGGGTYTFATRDLIQVLPDLIRNGLQQKYADKVAGKEGQAAYPTAKALGDMFAERFRAGIWNEKAGGGPRLDPFDDFCQKQAMRKAKEAFKAQNKKLDDVDAVKAWVDEYLADEAVMKNLADAWELIG